MQICFAARVYFGSMREIAARGDDLRDVRNLLPEDCIRAVPHNVAINAARTPLVSHSIIR